MAKPAYSLGPHSVRPLRRLGGGLRPLGPPQRQRRGVSAGCGVWVKIRASEAERAGWHAIAGSVDLTLSDPVRRSVGRRAPESRRFGNSLNQIARWACIRWIRRAT